MISIMRATWFYSHSARAVAFLVAALFALAVTRSSAPWDTKQPERGSWNRSEVTNAALPFMPDAEPFPASKTAKSASEAYAQLPISFEMVNNASQPDIKFKARGHDYSMCFTKKRVELSLRDANSSRGAQTDYGKISTRLSGSASVSQSISIGIKLANQAPNATLY